MGDLTSVAQISKLRVGQIYAASVMYGYFLKRLDQRFQLEKTMKNLPERLYPLTTSETLQRYATIRSREAVGIIEKNTETLFGKPEIVITPQVTTDSSKDEQIEISFGGMKRLVLEVVTFGSFLWDVENHVGEGTTLY
ncbi:unnamed protein product [Microthlaspi erraticum]|uniref:Uncharacterized protein n=1 Tax=Microthlaspi erraticum TaxID=1685480 RepID=A0A6D2KCT2_9BRAS|nr:unnamed protein product [Microthlaspi erraticum]CAA7060260.1 unnamed protein product [Microthlaspi erraticum]